MVPLMRRYKSRIFQGVTITKGPAHKAKQPHARDHIPSMRSPTRAHASRRYDWMAGIRGRDLFTLVIPFFRSSSLAHPEAEVET